MKPNVLDFVWILPNLLCAITCLHLVKIVNFAKFETCYILWFTISNFYIGVPKLSSKL